MATVRVEKLADYTTLSNRHIDDERLSLKAVGLLTYMLRLPDDWDFTLEWLARKHKDGLSSIRSAMAELEEAGYVIRGSQRRDNRGNFQGSDYIVRESPDGNRPVTACENRTRTACDFPMTENPISDNRTQPITNIPSTKDTNPPEAPQGAKRARRKRKEKAACEWEPELFERFWNLYPRGEGKAEARYAWDDLKPDRKLMKEMSAALKRQMKTEEWLRGVGVPWAVRWLNERRWEWEVGVALAAEESPDAAEDEEDGEDEWLY